MNAPFNVEFSFVYEVSTKDVKFSKFVMFIWITIIIKVHVFVTISYQEDNKTLHKKCIVMILFESPGFSIIGKYTENL